jgi:hypothetical protein
MAFYTDWPVSFCIAMLSALGYFAALSLFSKAKRAMPG